MLSYCTVEPHTLELLKLLCQEPYLKECRLVGGTALALQYGHRQSVDLDMFGSFDPEENYLFDVVLKPYAKVKKIKDKPNIKICFMDEVKVDFVNYSIYRALMSLTYFVDADPKEMPAMFEDVSWEEIKTYIKQQVASYERSAH